MKSIIQNFIQFVVLLVVLAGAGTMLFLGDENNGVSKQSGVSLSTGINPASQIKNNIVPVERRLRGKRSLPI